MEKAKVYFTRKITPETVIEMYKVLGIDLPGKVAVKVHSGEAGNQNYLRPEFMKPMVDFIGGTVVECNTAYGGQRNSTEKHLKLIADHGWTHYFKVDLMDAEGPDKKLEIPNGKVLKENYVGKNLMNYDSLLVLSHFKGHEATGFGGALKNIGMGCASRAGKMLLHADSKPVIDLEHCIGCRVCEKSCAHDAIHVGTDGKAVIDYGKCVGCGQCIAVCQHSGSVSAQDSDSVRMNCKIAEYSKAVVEGKQNFHVTLIMDVSPECDCWSGNDAAIVPNIGMAASFDPVALDQACADMVMNAPALPNTLYTDHYEKSKAELCHHGHNCQGEHDHFYFIHPDTNWKSGLIHGEKIGLGTMEYELVTVK